MINKNGSLKIVKITHKEAERKKKIEKLKSGRTDKKWKTKGRLKA